MSQNLDKKLGAFKGLVSKANFGEAGYRLELGRRGKNNKAL